MPSKAIIIVIEFMFLGLTARAKMSLSRAQNIFIPANINSIVLLNESKVISASSNLPTKPHSLLTRN